MRDLKHFARLDAERLESSEQNPLYLAARAVDAGNRDLAVQHWTAAQKQLPAYVMTSETTIQVLLGLGRLDELEALLKTGLKKSPASVHYLKGLARLDETRERFGEAAAWWSLIRKGSPREIDIWIREAYCLNRAGDTAAAAQVLELGARNFPDRHDIWIPLAERQETLCKWPQALITWDYIADTLGRAIGYACGGRVCAKMGNLNGAIQRLEKGHFRFPYDLDILQRIAEVEENRGNVAQAITYWAQLRMAHPQQQIGYTEAARCMRLIGKEDEAKLITNAATERFPGIIEVITN